MMSPVDRVIAYHERTKHHFERFAASLGYLDWANQPDPFRRFAGAPLIQLSLACSPDTGPVYDELFIEGAIAPAPVDFAALSMLFQYGLALSAWKQFRESRWALRINPSSGNLHPTEGYLLIGPVEGISADPCVYHYAPKEHGLELRTPIPEDAWERLVAGFPRGTCFVGLTSIHWREAWKYGERAFRYCQHDIGHAVAAIAFSAGMLGWRTRMLHEVDDRTLASLLGLDRDEDFVDAEREQAEVLLAIEPSAGVGDMCAAPATAIPREAVKAIAAGEWTGRASRPSVQHVDWPVIDEVVACCKKVESPASRDVPPIASPLAKVEQTGVLVIEKAPPPAFPLAKGGLRGGFSASDPLRASLPARRIIFQRRSAVSMDGRTSISADTFFHMLDRTLPRPDVMPWHALSPPACVHLFLFVHRVDDLDPGLYLLVRNLAALDSLRANTDPGFVWTRPPGCPEHLPLYFLKKGDARRVAGQVSCGQDIAADGAFSLGMIAEFAPRIREFGPWFYRRLFWETGMIGQVLYLEAEAAGVRATGIGCFFDDPVHTLLGLSNDDYQSLYHFTVGGAREDLRLMTWPPYRRNGE